MRNIIMILSCLLSIGAMAQRDGYDFGYIGVEVFQTNISESPGFEVGFVAATEKRTRLAIQLGMFKMPSKYPKELKEIFPTNPMDSVTTVSGYVGKTLVKNKTFMMSLEGGLGLMVAKRPQFDEENEALIQELLDGKSFADYKSSLTLPFKSRLEFKITEHFGVSMVGAFNLNWISPFYSYGVGVMYGGGFKSPFNRNKEQEEKRRYRT